MICDALLSEREAEIALSPGFRWGTTLLPGQPITREDVYNATAITYPAAYRMPMTGARLKEVLEDVADNLFNADPYYQQGGDMVRVGGVSYAIDVARPAGSRISDLTLLRTGKPIEAGTSYNRRGMGERERGHRGPADLGRRGLAHQGQGNGEPDARAGHGSWRLIVSKIFTHCHS